MKPAVGQRIQSRMDAPNRIRQQEELVSKLAKQLSGNRADLKGMRARLEADKTAV